MTVQRLTDTRSATASSVGTLQVEFDAPPYNFTALSSIVVPNAEPTASWGAFLAGGIALPPWGGSMALSVVQQVQTEGLTITGGNLTPGKTYVINRLGYVTDAPQESYFFPAPSPTSSGVAPPPTPVPPGGGGTPVPPPAPPPAPAPLGTDGAVVTADTTTGFDDIFANFPNAAKLNFTITNNLGGVPVWVTYGNPQANPPPNGDGGILIPSPGFLFEDTWKGPVFARTVAGTATLAWQQIVPT